MRELEAHKLVAMLTEYEHLIKGDILEIGASDLTYRTLTKPYIQNIYRNHLQSIANNLLTADLKDDGSIDIVGDIRDEPVKQAVNATNVTCLALNNLLEHVEDPYDFAQHLMQLKK